jgi:hypothetical protein
MIIKKLKFHLDFYKIKPVYFFVILLIVISFQLNVFAVNRETAAVFTFDSYNCPKRLATITTDMVSAKVFETKIYTLIERSQIDMVLKELELQQTGCTDASCAVEVGKMLSAGKIIMGSIHKIDTYTIVMKVVNVADNKVDANYKAEALSEGDIEKAIDEIIEKLRYDFKTAMFLSLSVSGGYRMPLGDFGKICGGGYGISVNVNLNNFLVRSGILSFSTGFSYFGGKDEAINSIMSIPAVFYFGYSINASRSIKLIPYLGAGYLINMMNYDQDNYDELGEYKYSNKIYYEPAASVKMDIDIAVSPNFHLYLSPYYTYFYDGDMAGQIINADIGVKILF